MIWPKVYSLDSNNSNLCGDGAKLHEQRRFWWYFEPAVPLPGLQMVAGGASCLSLLGNRG